MTTNSTDHAGTLAADLYSALYDHARENIDRIWTAGPSDPHDMCIDGRFDLLAVAATLAAAGWRKD